MKRKTVETKTGTNMSPCLCLIYSHAWVTCLPSPHPHMIAIFACPCCRWAVSYTAVKMATQHPAFTTSHHSILVASFRIRGPGPKKDFDWSRLGPITFAEGLRSYNWSGLGHMPVPRGWEE